MGLSLATFMASSIKRQTARALLEVLKDPDTPAIRKIEIAGLIVDLMGKTQAKPVPASTEKTDSVFGGLDEK